MNVAPTDPCLCESGRQAKECCVVGGRLAPRQALPPARSKSKKHEHEKCYARPLKNCCDTISSEHAISAVLLERLDKDGGVYVRGFPWQKAESQKMSVPSLGSNILCRDHNSDLSGLDSFAGRFVDHVERVGSEFNATSATTEWVWLINGHDLERWLLKVLCGILASKSARSSNGEPIAFDIPEKWVRILYAQFAMQPSWGLYVSGAVGDKYDAEHGTVAFSPLSVNGVVAGLQARLGGLHFALAMADVPEPDRRHPDGGINPTSVFRPNGLFWTYSKATKGIVMHWDGARSGLGVELSWDPGSETSDSAASITPAGDHDWVAPDDDSPDCDGGASR